MALGAISNSGAAPANLSKLLGDLLNVLFKIELRFLHEPNVYCIAKGKAHKKYEYGCKASLTLTHGHHRWSHDL